MLSLEGRNPPDLAQKVLSQAESSRVRFVDLHFTDVVGIVKSVTIPIAQFPAAIEHGKWFDGSSIEGFARIAESDMFLIPDLSTYAIVPTDDAEDGRHRSSDLLGLQPERRALPGRSPRGADARDARGARPRLHLQVRPRARVLPVPARRGRAKILALPHDQAGYFDLSTDLAYSVRKEMVNDLEAMGIQVETSHHEVAIGQHEIDFEYTDAISAADYAVTFKWILKAVAQRHGLYATFMPKPLFGINGSGMHVHQSFFDAQGNNAFSDPKDEYGLSQLARYFIAGQLAHARGMSAVLAPLVNSYKRLVPGYEAPVYVSWAGRTARR